MSRQAALYVWKRPLQQASDGFTWKSMMPRSGVYPSRDPDPKNTNPFKDGTDLCCRVNGRALDIGCDCLFKLCEDCIRYNFDIPSKIYDVPINANADAHIKFHPESIHQHRYEKRIDEDQE